MKREKQRLCPARTPAPREIVPEYLTNPLTDYRYVKGSGGTEMELPPENVRRMREFDMENEK